ncbi:hypothetical protein HDU97_003137 [Phlyctochytrium planicorne]|nr:hypothetical protein HDU97_003088 [Phlyctochytrium planicorne]KAJ3109707.1 hypothetical protein HDU97_003137 [Phlyctochytrium planicorne]
MPILPPSGTAGLGPHEASTSHLPVSYSIPIDPSLLDDIELQSRLAAADLDALLTSLTYRIGEMTNLTQQSVAAHSKAATALVHQLNVCTQGTVKLITLMDELSHDMVGVQNLGEQIQTIKRSLDWLEKMAFPK